MRVGRIRHEGRVSTAIVDGEVAVPVAEPVLDVLRAGGAGGAPGGAGGGTGGDGAGRALPLDLVTPLAPVARPPKLLAIGLNDADHIAELGREAPEFPVFFNKQSSCVVGPGDAIEVPRASPMVDFEGELGMVIGRRCRHVPPEQAPEVVAGFTVVNDVSVRDWQFASPTMTLGKSWDTHGPLGPWIVTPDELGDPHDLRIRTWVSGELMQDGSTGGMVHDCWQQIATLTTVCTLEPGDVVATGTPAGVGVARDPQRWLVPGDTVAIEIEGVGMLENPVVEEADDAPVIV